MRDKVDKSGVQQMLSSVTGAMQDVEWQIAHGHDLLVEDYQELLCAMHKLFTGWDRLETEFVEAEHYTAH